MTQEGSHAAAAVRSATLRPTEERRIRRLASARHAPASWLQRARIVTVGWEGAQVGQIAAQLGCQPRTVYRWLHRFNAGGIDGLGDLPRSGRPRRLGELERGQLIAFGPQPATGAAAAGAGRYLGLAQPKPRRRIGPWMPWLTGPVIPRTFPPPPGWSTDGYRIKAPWVYDRGAWKTWVDGALRPGDGQAITVTAPSRDSVGYQQLLAAVEAANPTGEIAVINDNLPSHSSFSTRTWLAGHLRIRQVFIPVGTCG